MNNGNDWDRGGRTFGVTQFGCITRQNDLPSRIHTGNEEANAALKLVISKVSVILYILIIKKKMKENAELRHPQNSKFYISLQSYRELQPP